MTMTMQTLVQEYLDERRGLVFALTIPGTQLMAFARYADASGHRGPLTRELMRADHRKPTITAMSGTTALASGGR